MCDCGNRGNSHIVIIVNGFLPIPRPMGHIKAAYAKEGYTPKVVPFRLSDKLDVPAYAKSIANMVKAEACHTNYKIELVGTSMGGLSSFYALAFFGIEQYVNMAVAVAAPFNGTGVSIIGRHVPILGNSARQMTRGSELLERLRSTILPVGPKYLTISGTLDRACPWPSTRFQDVPNLDIPCNHIDVMFRAWPHQWIARTVIPKKAQPA